MEAPARVGVYLLVRVVWLRARVPAEIKVIAIEADVFGDNGSGACFARLAVAGCFVPGCFASPGGSTGAGLPVGGGSPGCFASPG
eukprot:5755598-Prymnesium_polylepis.1